MELVDALYQRRSIRKFTEEPVSNEHIAELMKAAMAAPSGCNFRPWRFIAVKTPELVAKAIELAPHGKYNATLAFYVIGLTDVSPNMWFEDCAAATENVLLRVTDLGLGAVWCAEYPFKDRSEPAKEFLGLSEKEEVFSLILIGHPAEEKEPRTQYEESKVLVL